MWDAAAAGAGDPAGDTAPDADPDAGGAAACSATCIVADPWTALPPRAATAARIARIDYHAPGSGCAGPLLRAELVPVYAACTRVAAGLFALSAVADSAVALRVCSDAACTACTDPPPAAAWPRAAACASRGPYDVRGLYLAAADAPAPPPPAPAANTSSPGTSNAGASSNTTDGGATSSASIPLTAPIILSAVAVAIALVTLTAVVVWLVAMRRGPPLPPLRDQDAQTSLDGRPTIVESTSASVVPAGSLAHLAHDRTSPFSPHALGSPQARAFSASRVVQILEQPHTVVIDYDPQMIDELRLRAGDQVLLESVWSDGWAHGYNITTGERGTLAIATLDANSHLLVPVDDPRLSSSPESFTRPSAESAGTTGDGQRASPSGDDLGQRGSVF
ncbi:hypothetical protein HK105_205866 [Polyrhizophydium stewartii]|uniref:SH3 domain-containing protein n=1 Tax=Polyrhizophydium stewartii TaxID=2732419 RepID=A0ABR4N4R2_9FUNG|nr:hypothetical protein HK105_004036 [Polyrhizophydium stewartii]